MNPPYCTNVNHPDFERDYGRFQNDMEKEWKSYAQQQTEEYMAQREEEYFEHRGEQSPDSIKAQLEDYLIK